ncbi:nucleotidyltransferase family protein [Gallaecimonas sp. GXIMD4217]|uniref:nucleotidyltransferase family protein n=1 Tax=Gallaecimonas sp. GXIMD4217 TaxID=3131927 RepID=UPI00311AE2DA
MSYPNLKQRASAILTADAWRRACLEAAAELALPDWAIGAGFVRNAIWDELHGHTEATPLNDLDLIYFDPHDRSPERDRALEARLSALLPAPWSVKNQARMHLKHGHAPYRGSLQALGQWVEVATCVGVRLEGGRCRFLAPFGLGDNFRLLIRANPLNPRPELVRRRIREKGWLTRWPRLTLLETLP